MTTPEQARIAALEAEIEWLRADCAKWEKMARAAMSVAVDAYDVPCTAALEAEVERLKLQVMRREAALTAFGATAQTFEELDAAQQEKG